ncbi:MAG: hypothetical protein M3421_15085 [Bacteroidota bacterium]|nr:hypothetical protein [Bacteroidota bacterium]
MKYKNRYPFLVAVNETGHYIGEKIDYNAMLKLTFHGYQRMLRINLALNKI